MRKINLTSDRLILEPFKSKYVTEEYLQWITDDGLTKYIEKASPDISIDDLRDFVDELDGSKNDIFFRIILKENNLHIGNIRLGPIDFEKSSSSFGILIGRTDYHKKGLAQEAINTIKDYAFKDLQLSLFQFECITDNFGAMSLYKKMGFIKKEFKEKFKKGNIIYDQVLWYQENPQN